jgi:hypothetical protein
MALAVNRDSANPTINLFMIMMLSFLCCDGGSHEQGIGIRCMALRGRAAGRFPAEQAVK